MRLWVVIPNTSAWLGVTAKIFIASPLFSKFETTLHPTVPRRSVAPITATDRGEKRESRPPLADALETPVLTRGVAKGLDNWLTEFLTLSGLPIFSRLQVKNFP
jgi:hypothetical protein